jgi:hypothetical protein
MQNLFSNYSTLFIGYGGSDPHLEDLLEEQAFNMNYSNRRLPQNFLVSLANKTDKVIENYKRKRRTEIIAINDYSDYEVLLHRLAVLHPRANLMINHSHSHIIMDDN